MDNNFLTFVSGKLSESSINAAFERFLTLKQAAYPGEFDTAYFTVSYIQEYSGGHVMFSDIRLINTLLGYDFAKVQRLSEPFLIVVMGIPDVIATMEEEYATHSNKFKQDLDANEMKQEALLACEDEWRSGSLSEEMSVLLCEKEVLLSNLDTMMYYFKLDMAALEAKHRLNQGNESKDDHELITQVETTERLVRFNVMIRLPELETISFTPSKLKMFDIA